MKGFLLILLLSFFAPLQCYNKSNHFFVTRRDTKEAICITSEWFNDVSPTFDLDKLQIPQDVGIKYWDWLSEWQLQNDTDVRSYDPGKMLIAGNQPFHFVASGYRATFVDILASNISLWMADSFEPRGAGLKFEVDHLNETTKLKDTTLKYCTRNPQRKKAKCTIVDYKNGTNFLNDGNRWTEFLIHLKENGTGVEMLERSYGKEKPVVQCTWNNTNISNPFRPYPGFKVFAKSHQRNAAIFSEGYSYADLKNNNEMKRNYTKRSSGKLCVWVYWTEEKSNDSDELIVVRNLVSGRVQPATNTTHKRDLTAFQWNHLDAGEYEITLRFDKRQPWNINLCPESNIVKTWVSIPKAITKCQFDVGRDTEFSAGPSSPPDPTVKPTWSLEEWEHVCNRLGIFSNDSEVQIKFCDWKGCNFSKCPHLQDDPAYIFDF